MPQLRRVRHARPGAAAGGSALTRRDRDTERERDVIAHIDLGFDERQHPGIRGLTRFRPETAGPLNALAETLLRAPHPTLTPGERELIAAYVSALNDCGFCRASHSATAAAQLPAGMSLVEQVRADVDAAPVGEKLRALLRIAAAVQRGGREVTGELVDAARAAGATDLELHDTVLIAAAFCMYNRYVDGLAAFTPEDPRAYETAARHLVAHGYDAG